MPYIERPQIKGQGARIFYSSSGSGPALLLCHGFSATSTMWGAQIAAFKTHYQVICWDMLGHGESDSPDDPAFYSVDATVQDMAAILDACGADKAVLCGHSLGGFMSLAFNLRHPARVRALMLCNTGPGYKSDSARADWNVTAEKQARAFAKQGLAAVGHSEEMQLGTHRTALGLEHGARGMLAQNNASIIESLPHIAVPALVLVGEKDRGYLAAAEYMAGKIPNARKIVIENAGHATNLHQPAAFNRVAGDFLNSLV